MAVLYILRGEFPSPACALQHRSPFELLVATILSAQCTDERVNKVTPALFKEYPTPARLSVAAEEKLIQLIHSTGFFRTKARNLIACARAIQQRHGGRVPDSMEELTALPGVGRKTANVVLGNAFGIPGLAVDTHVKRLSNLLEFSVSDDPAVIEQDLCDLIPQQHWTEASHLLILHGRKTCIARRPKCSVCPLLNLCPSASIDMPGGAETRRRARQANLRSGHIHSA